MNTSSDQPANVVLSIEDATYRIGEKSILEGISLDFQSRSLSVLIGPNGAGKSTLLAALSGDLKECRSYVKLSGRNLQEWGSRPLALQRSVMTQDHSVRFAFSVREVVAMGRLPHPANPAEDEKIASNAIQSADITHLEHRNVQTLSGGEVSRTAFARVLSQQTPIIFLDEPTAALDLFHQEKLLKELRSLANNGACVIAVLHDLNLASAYADRIVMLASGKVEADGTPEQVFKEETIEKVYRQKVLVIPHPTRGVPLIISDDSTGNP